MMGDLRDRRLTPQAPVWIPERPWNGALPIVLAVLLAGCSQEPPSAAGTAGVERAMAGEADAEPVSDGVPAQAFEGRWEASDDLGTAHVIDIRWPVVTWSVDGQGVRQEWCSLAERREDRVWFRCAVIEPGEGDAAVPPSLVEPDAGEAGLTERGFALGEDGHLRLVPLAELAWTRSWLVPDAEVPGGAVAP